MCIRSDLKQATPMNYQKKNTSTIGIPTNNHNYYDYIAPLLYHLS